MHLIGPANWHLPAVLGRILPHLEIEAPATATASTTAAATAPRGRNSATDDDSAARDSNDANRTSSW
jgi:hypothetical protein